MLFRWNAWNIDHAARHGVAHDEAERVVRNAIRPYPEHMGDAKLRVIGPGAGNRLVQVIFILDDDATVYIIHARPVTTARDKRRYRKRQP
jgi:uncharacterized DUF497 family protein